MSNPQSASSSKATPRAEPKSPFPNPHSPLMPKMAVAHDWLTNMGGAEKLLLAIHELYPDAPIFTSVFDSKNMPDEFSKLDIRTSWLQKLPLIKYKHQLVAPLRAKAFESFSFSMV